MDSGCLTGKSEKTGRTWRRIKQVWTGASVSVQKSRVVATRAVVPAASGWFPERTEVVEGEVWHPWCWLPKGWSHHLDVVLSGPQPRMTTFCYFPNRGR